jgi:carboxymethylenebutenolidase
MSRRSVAIETKDGVCPASVLQPEEGTWPAAIFFMDAPGIRPALIAMAERLSSHGYVVLLPDLYYRAGPYEPVDPGTLVSDSERRAGFAKYFASTSFAKARADTAAFLSFLDTYPAVKGPKVGCVGYCMGGGMALTAAGAYPDRVAVAASFHGGRLATDHPESPHLLAPKMQGQIYVAGAENDASFPTEQRLLLEKSLADAGVRHLVETYDGARHGFAVPDHPAYVRAAAERHWSKLLELFQGALASGPWSQP